MQCIIYDIIITIIIMIKSNNIRYLFNYNIYTFSILKRTRAVKMNITICVPIGVGDGGGKGSIIDTPYIFSVTFFEYIMLCTRNIISYKSQYLVSPTPTHYHFTTGFFLAVPEVSPQNWHICATNRHTYDTYILFISKICIGIEQIVLLKGRIINLPH